MRVFSFGGGVQSVSALVLAARGDYDCKTFLFANVGEDSERQATLDYFRAYAQPFAAEHGLELLELRRRRRIGSPPTLLQHLHRSARSIGIPVRVGTDVGAPGTRQCTTDWKIRVIYRWLREHGASEETPARLGLGISMDEIERVGKAFDARFPAQRKEYPLVERRLWRDGCEAIIAGAGLPVPPKSSCWFCPLHTLRAWQEQAEKEPTTFKAACELEELLNARRRALGKDEIFFTSRLKPLPVAIKATGQLDLFDGCESGYCHT